MVRHRIIPILLIDEENLVKGEQFKKHRYLGDPVNAVKIFNEKEVDELVILDIGKSSKSRQPDFSFIEKIASEAFMPLAYGGGITSLDQVQTILSLGVEKVIFNSAAFNNPDLVAKTADKFGSSATVVSIDVKPNLFGTRYVYTVNGRKNTGVKPVIFAKKMESLGAGELIVTAITHEGMMAGMDLELIKEVSASVSIPVIANGGAGGHRHIVEAMECGVSAIAAGSMFLFYGKHKALLISYNF